MNNEAIFDYFQTLSEPVKEIQAHKIAELAIFMVILGVVALITVLLQSFLFGLSGERMTRRLRQQSFMSILKQEMGYFDDKNNGVGHLTSRLAREAPLVKGVSVFCNTLNVTILDLL